MEAVFLISRGEISGHHGGGKVRHDLLESARRAGYHIALMPGMGWRYFLHLAQLRIPRRSTVILPYPGVPAIRQGGLLKGIASLSEVGLLAAKKLSGRWRVYLYVYDLPIEQREAAGDFSTHLLARFAESLLLGMSEVIGVMGEEMEDLMRRRYDWLTGRFVRYEFLPYYAPQIAKGTGPGYPRKVAFAGNLSQRRIGALAQLLPRKPGVKYCFYGPDGDWLAEVRDDFVWHGEFDASELSAVLNETADFGLLLYGASHMAQLRYLHMATTSKLFAYVYAGLPILTYSYRRLARIVTSQGLGFVFDDPAALADIVLNVDEQIYKEIAGRVALFAQGLASRNMLAEFVQAGSALIRRTVS